MIAPRQLRGVVASIRCEKVVGSSTSKGSGWQKDARALPEEEPRSADYKVCFSSCDTYCDAGHQDRRLPQGGIGSGRRKHLHSLPTPLGSKTRRGGRRWVSSGRLGEGPLKGSQRLRVKGRRQEILTFNSQASTPDRTDNQVPSEPRRPQGTGVCVSPPAACPRLVRNFRLAVVIFSSTRGSLSS